MMMRRFFLFSAQLIVCAIFAIVAFCAIQVQAQTVSAGSATVIQLTVLNPVSTSTYYISIVKNGSGSGTVTSSNGAITCGSICFENNIPNASSTILTAIADSGATFTGWSVGGDTTVCPAISTCSVATSTVVTANFNLNVSPIPPTPQPIVSPPIEVSPSGRSQFFFEDFSSESNSTSSVINWYTTLPSLSNISWGVNSDDTSGSGSETSYGTSHSIELDNLSPNTVYLISIQATSQSGSAIDSTYIFRTLPAINSIPINASYFTGQVSFGGNILLNWQNPFEPDFSSVIITRGTRFFPRDPNEGYLVYQGSEEAALDTNVAPGQEYYYSLFTENSQGKYSSGTLLKYGLPSISGQPATTASLFGGTTNAVTIGTATTTNTIATTTLTAINFSQNNKQISSSALTSTISIEANTATLVQIPANAVPKNTEETIITVGEKTPEQQSFIFQKLDDGSLQTLIPAVLPAGSTTFRINFLGLRTSTALEGVFVGQGSPAPFIPQSLWSYFIQTYISNNFLSTTLPFFIMFFELIGGVIIIVIILKNVLK